MPGEIIKQEIEKGKKEAAAGREGKVTGSGAYLLAERMADLKNDLQRELTEIKREIGSLRQEMKQEIDRLDGQIGSLRQEMKQEIGRLDGKIDSKIDGLRQDMKGEIRHLDGKLNNTILAAVSVFFAVLLGSAAIVWAIYQVAPQ